jgi:RHS repeat-associated protein
VYELVDNGVSYFPLFDGLGSVTALTDGTGAVAGRLRYSAFGVPQSSGITNDGFTFTGHQYDSATGLVYARARYYDPTIGRFLSEDPKPSVNPYPYVSNNPYNTVDPSGAQESEACAGQFEWPPAWDEWNEANDIVDEWEKWKERLEEESDDEGGGNEYSAILEEVTDFVTQEDVLVAYLEWVAERYYMAACALEGGTRANP